MRYGVYMVRLDGKSEDMFKLFPGYVSMTKEEAETRAAALEKERVAGSLRKWSGKPDVPYIISAMPYRVFRIRYVKDDVEQTLFTTPAPTDDAALSRFFYIHQPQQILSETEVEPEVYEHGSYL